jgi:hypothetical protein
MLVYYGHVWYEHGALQSAVLTGWQITSGPHEGAVLVMWPGESGLPRVVAGGGWHADRVSAELDVCRQLRRIAEAASVKAKWIREAT